MAKPLEKFALRGQILSYEGDPFKDGPEAAVNFNSDGMLVVADGVIIEVGAPSEILPLHPGIHVDEYRDDLIMAGFIDAHVHYPQTEIVGSYGEQLLEWLNRYTFPAESKFSDYDYAAASADIFLDECLRNGITAASVYCTVHPQSVDAFFSAAEERGFRMAAGKVMMDRNAPEGLLDSPEQSYDESKRLIERWHRRARLTYAITPRFAPTSSPAQLEAAGALWKEKPTTLKQTHMSESIYEIEWVKELYPDCKDYLDVYERYGLTGSGANFGHAIHLTEREIEAFISSGSAISHCPTSNIFIGSGLFDMGELRDCHHPITVGLATDIGGGSSFSMFDTMKGSYEICQLQGYSLHPAKAFYLATVGSAETLKMGDKIGNLRPGFEADIIVIDLNSRPIIASRMQHASDLWEALFIQMIMADDRAVRATYIGGRKMYERSDQAMQLIA